MDGQNKWTKKKKKKDIKIDIVKSREKLNLWIERYIFFLKKKKKNYERKWKMLSGEWSKRLIIIKLN